MFCCFCFSSAMDWRAIWTITTGLWNHRPRTSPPYVASLVFFFINMVIGVGHARDVQGAVALRNVRGHVLDFLCTMESVRLLLREQLRGQALRLARGWPWPSSPSSTSAAERSATNIDNPVKAFHGWLVGESEGSYSLSNR